MARNVFTGVCFVLLMAMQAGCSNPHKEAARASTEASKAEADVHRQKADILEDYKKCLKKNKSDETACESYKRALEAM